MRKIYMKMHSYSEAQWPFVVKGFYKEKQSSFLQLCEVKAILLRQSW